MTQKQPPSQSSSQEEQRQIIVQLQTTFIKASDLQVNLILQGLTQKAEEVGQKNRRLLKKIDELIQQLLNQWRTNAQSAISEGKKRNQALQKAIRNIKNKIDTAQNVVKALGKLDDAINTAKDILKKLAV